VVANTRSRRRRLDACPLGDYEEVRHAGQEWLATTPKKATKRNEASGPKTTRPIPERATSLTVPQTSTGSPSPSSSSSSLRLRC
jgi:hypothetical protein